jgi:hypothetical protein
MQEKARQAVDWAAAAAAARAEIGFLRHMGGCHAGALQLLEAERQQRHMAERGRRAAYVAASREALGAQPRPVLPFFCGDCMAHSSDVLWHRIKRRKSR